MELWRDYANVIKTFEMRSNLKNKKRIMKIERYKNTKNRSSEQRKLSFTRGIGWKFGLIKNLTEQNTDHTQIMHAKHNFTISLF